MSAAPDDLGRHYYRAFLTARGRRVYDRLCEQLLRREYSGRTSVSDVPGLTAHDCFAAYRALRDDRPEFFFLGSSVRLIQAGRRAVLEYPVLYSGAVIARVEHLLEQRLSALVRGTQGLSPVDRETAVYERIAHSLIYKDSGGERSHSVAGPLLTGEGVCEGHNALLLLALRRAGIPCIKMCGTAAGEDHCWTVAWPGGTPVHCDVTWDRAVNGVVRFAYLNLTDAQIARDHGLSGGPGAPRCTDGSLNYYRRRGAWPCSGRELAGLLLRAGNTRRPVYVRMDGVCPPEDIARNVQAAARLCRLPAPCALYVCGSLNAAVIAPASERS